MPTTWPAFLQHRFSRPASDCMSASSVCIFQAVLGSARCSRTLLMCRKSAALDFGQELSSSSQVGQCFRLQSARRKFHPTPFLSDTKSYTDVITPTSAQHMMESQTLCLPRYSIS